MIGLRDKEIEARLERLARKTGRSKSFYVRQALQEFLEDREDYLLGLARLEAGGRRLSLEEAEKERYGRAGKGRGEQSLPFFDEKAIAVAPGSKGGKG